MGKTPGVASVGFHLNHLRGVVDRLFTYARGEMLTDDQMKSLRAETVAGDVPSIQTLLDDFKNQVAAAIDQLKNTNTDTLTDRRFIGCPKARTQLHVLARARRLRSCGLVLGLPLVIPVGVSVKHP